MGKKLSVEDLAYADLLCYAALQWPDYIISAHHQIIAEHLQALEKREIRRLLITTPPRHGKTMLAVEFFGSWYLGRNPSHQVIFSTYSTEKAEDHGLKVKQLMMNENFNVVFPNCVLSQDSKAKSKLATTLGGHFFSVGVGGAIVGRGANLLILDDLVKSREEAESITSLRRIEQWFKGTAYTRLMPQGVIIFITTRWTKDDLAGIILRNSNNWVHLDLKALCESKERDPLHREPGEALWPAQYDKDDLKEIKENIGTREWSAQYQQNPVDEEGGIIQFNWIKYYDKKPLKFDRIIQSWDTAFSKNSTNSPSVCLTFGKKDKYHYLLHVFRKHIDYPTLKRTAERLYNDYDADIVLIEDRASGQSLAQELKEGGKMKIKSIFPKGSKEQRMASQSAKIEMGLVLFPNNAPWLTDTITELIAFPHSKYNDIADAMSQYLKYTDKKRYINNGKNLFWK